MTLKGRATRGAGSWSDKARDRADQVTSSAVRRIAAHSGEDDLYGRVAAVLDLSDEQATVRLESFFTAFVRVVRQEDGEDLSERDALKAAVRRRRRIGLACMPSGLIGIHASSLYCEAAILCNVEQLHRLGLTDEQLAAHLLALWKIMPDYEQAAVAIAGTGTSVAAFHSARTKDAASAGFDKRGEIGKLDALKFLWGSEASEERGGRRARLREPAGRANAQGPGEGSLRTVGEAARPPLSSHRSERGPEIEGFLVVLVIVLILGLHIAVQVASRQTRSATTSLSPADALEAFEKCFIAKANQIDRSMGEVLVRSRLKRHAPTITAAGRSTADGTEVDVWMSDFVVLYRWGIPLGKYHAGWALRKQFKYLRRLRALEATPQQGRAESTEP